ncbi:MAG: response regulator [Gammaproteobacteria bacterium]
MNKLRIFLVDDHAVIREGLRLLLGTQSDMEVSGQAGDGRSALEQVAALQPDVVLMDLSLPLLNGIQVTEQLKQAYPKLSILALTRHRDLSHLRQIMQAGASGYVLKQAAAQVLIGAIRIVAAGGTYLDPELAGRVLHGYLGQQAQRELSQEAELSEREEEVLRLIAWGRSNKEIAAQLAISIKTVEYHKARSMEKLGLYGRAGIVRYAVGQGWLQEL